MPLTTESRSHSKVHPATIGWFFSPYSRDDEGRHFVILQSSWKLLIGLMVPITGIVVVIGLVMSFLTVAALGTNAKGVWIDALLAPAMFWIVLAVLLIIPWNGSYVDDGMTISNQFPYPMEWAGSFACVSPVVHQILRARRFKQNHIGTKGQ